MSITEFISKQPAERQKLLSQLHEIIIQNDKTVTPVIAPMMGKEIIIYNAPGILKYGLASVKNYMSLHVLPMYGSAIIYEKYKALLKEASFSQAVSLLQAQKPGRTRRPIYERIIYLG